ncbi:MAG: C40 family peptidase [Sulfuricurvum sp.]
MNRRYLLLPLVLLSTLLHADSQRREPSLFLEYEREVTRSLVATEDELSPFQKIVTKLTPTKPQTPFVVMLPASPTVTSPALPNKPSIGHDTLPYLVINKPTSPQSNISQVCPDSRTVSSNLAPETKSKKSIIENITSAKERVLARAKEFLGTPYGFGNKNAVQTDCSGFTQQVFRQFGVSLPHSAAEQASLGIYVDTNDLQVGDLMFYQTYKKEPSHVAIYAGNGQIIHASYRNKQVQYDTIDKGYYKQRFMYAKRIALNNSDATGKE